MSADYTLCAYFIQILMFFNSVHLFEMTMLTLFKKIVRIYVSSFLISFFPQSPLFVVFNWEMSSFFVMDIWLIVQLDGWLVSWLVGYWVSQSDSL